MYHSCQLAVVGALLGKSGFAKKLNRMNVTKNGSSTRLKMEILSPPISACLSWASLALKPYMTGKVTGKKAGAAVIKTVVRFSDGGKEIYKTKVSVKR